MNKIERSLLRNMHCWKRLRKKDKIKQQNFPLSQICLASSRSFVNFDLFIMKIPFFCCRFFCLLKNRYFNQIYPPKPKRINEQKYNYFLFFFSSLFRKMMTANKNVNKSHQLYESLATKKKHKKEVSIFNCDKPLNIYI